MFAYFIMKRQILLDAICYENSLLKIRYNELIKYIIKLETEVENLKHTNSVYTDISCNDYYEGENTEPPTKKTVFLVENSSTTTPLFQISKYCSSINQGSHNIEKSDTISELTM